MKPGHKVYLGDGAYAQWDGDRVILTTEDGIRVMISNLLQPEPVKPVSAYATPVMVSDPTRQVLHELRYELQDAATYGRAVQLANIGVTVTAITKAMAAVDTLAKVRLKLDIATKTTWRHCNDPALDGLLDDLNRLVKP